MGKGVKSDGQKRTRSTNFTYTEVEVLTVEVEARRKYLFGELKVPNFTQAARDRAWSAVAEKVNAVSPVIRSVKDLKSKFSDLKTRTKQKANKLHREAKRTGGGQNHAAKFSSSEELLCSFIGKESIEGIKGGGVDIGVSSRQNLDIDKLSPQVQVESQTNHDLQPKPEKSLQLQSHFQPNSQPQPHCSRYVINSDNEDQENAVISPPSPFQEVLAQNDGGAVNIPNIAVETPKQKKTLRKCMIEISRDTNVHLNNIYQEFQTFNKMMKRKLEIEEEKLILKKKKIEMQIKQQAN